MKLTRLCPICGNDSGEMIHKVNFTKGRDEFVPSEYSVVSCYKCGFVFNDTSWTQSDYNRYYSQTSKYTGGNTLGAGGFSDGEIARYERQIERFERYIPARDASIADVGCAKGGLLATLQKKGYKNLFGIEPSSDCLSHLEKFGIYGYNAAVPSLTGIDRQFDVITLSAVAEHIYDLPLMVQSLHKILNDDGVLYVEVPNAEEYRSLFCAPYYYFDFEHINHFSKEYLAALFAGYFECVSSSSSAEPPYNVCYCVFKKSVKINKTVDFFNAKYLDAISEYLARSLKTNASIYRTVTNLDCGGGGVENTFSGEPAHISARNLRRVSSNPLKTIFGG